MRPIISTDRADLWLGNALDVYEQLSPASFELVISDGPYGIGKDRQWDPGSVDALPELYEPHVAAWGRLCKPAASVYLWGTSASWAAVHPVLLAHGWQFRALVTWDKGGTKAELGAAGMRTWPDVTEVAGFYQRDGDTERPFAGLAEWMEAQRKGAGLRRADIDAAAGCANVSQYWWQAKEWRCPTEDKWALLQDLAPGFFAASWEQMKLEEREARRQYDAERAPFTLPHGVTNVWRHPLVSGGERLRAADGSTLHPCQKPLSFYRRMIRASTRPGASVLEPFGGTCRAAVACHRLGDRRAVCIERDRRYLDAVRPSLEFVGGDDAETGQLGFWGLP